MWFEAVKRQQFSIVSCEFYYLSDFVFCGLLFLPDSWIKTSSFLLPFSSPSRCFFSTRHDTTRLLSVAVRKKKLIQDPSVSVDCQEINQLCFITATLLTIGCMTRIPQRWQKKLSLSNANETHLQLHLWRPPVVSCQDPSLCPDLLKHEADQQ